MRDRRVLGVAALAIVVLLAILGPFRGFAGLDRDVTSSNPGLTPYTTIVKLTLRPGDEACVAPVPYEARSARAKYRVEAAREPTPPLEVTASGPGWSATGRTAGYPPGGQLVEARFDAPGRDLLGRFCWRNAGRTPVALLGTNEPKSTGPAVTTVRGQQREADVELAIVEGEKRSLVDRPGQIIERAAQLSGGLPAWLVWIVALLTVVGLPLGAAIALWKSVPRD